MTTTDNSGEQLTRRQLRELRLTGQNPVVPDDGAPVEESAPADPVPPRRDAPVNNPLPRPAEPIIVPAPEPVAEAPADSDSRRLTRRELRDLERVRTASVPIIQPGAADGVAPTVEPAAVSAEEPVASVEIPASAGEEDQEAPQGGLAAALADERADAAEDAEPVPDAVDASSEQQSVWAPPVEVPVSEAPAAEPTPAITTAPPAPTFESPAKDTGQASGPTLNSSFGARVAPGASEDETSFDELISRDSGGSSAAGHSLVLPDATLPPLTAPVTSTGAMLVTGTFNLPELGSHGHAPGVADGKDVDAVLIDGELPAASSPTPIAATAAVSQAKAPGEIIKPPVPEKSNKLMLVLAITAGVLALALVGVIVGAALTGMMQ